MKKILKNALITGFLFLLLGFYTTAAGSGELTSLRIEKISTGYKQIVVELAGFRGPVVLQLLPEKGEHLIQEEVPAGTAYAKIFNLSQLPDGNYTIYVGSELREVLQPVRVTPSDVIMYEEQRREFFAPVAVLRNRNLDVNWFNSRIAHVEVAILDEHGAEVFKDNIKNVVRIERRYLLGHLSRRLYTLRITTPHKTYYQSVDLR